MYAVEFKTQIKNGHICVPEELRPQLSGSIRVLVLVEGENAHSVVQLEKPSTGATNTDVEEHLEEKFQERQPGESLLAYRLRNPYPVSDFKPLSREEVHERRADYKSD